MQSKPSMYGPPPLPAHVFNYHGCRTWELRVFPQARKLGVDFSTRDQAILELQKADAASTFRFLNLPPELRKHVYRVLLALKATPRMIDPIIQLGTEPKYFPEILSISKQVYDEARSYLYGENEFDVTFAAETAAHKLGRYQLKCEACCLRSSEWDGMYMMGMGQLMSLQKRSPDWPEYLRRAEKLNIKIDLPLPPGEVPFRAFIHVTIGSFVALNRASYDLASFLQAGSEAGEIAFDIACEVDRLHNKGDLADISLQFASSPPRRRPN